ncbi:MAG: polysaccharide deacetylase family protein [Balneolales bacterium]
MAGIIRTKLSKVRRKLRPKGIILMYHRVADVDNDPWELCVTPANFKEQLKVLSCFDEVLTLHELSDQIMRKNRLKKAVALTFDDGYRDNLYEAKTWLEVYKIPATFFIAAGYINSNKEFWWDELERILLTPGQLPDKLKLDTKQFSWNLEEDSILEKDDYQKYKNWTAGEHTPTKRHGLYNALWEMIGDYSPENQKDIMSNVTQWSGNGHTGRVDYYPMTKNELIQFSKSECIHIGAHTSFHSNLSVLPLNEQKKEIFEGKQMLETWLKKEITTFSYPYGKFNKDSLNLVKEAGFDFAYTTGQCLVNGRQSPYTLPRFQVKNWNGEEFKQKLSDWLERY